MSGRKIDAYMLHCAECSYEATLTDDIEAEKGTLEAKGAYFCPRCGAINDLPKEVA